MEAIKQTRLHPLLTAAAVSVTVFSAVGVAALTGLLPPSIGSGKSEAPTAVAAAPVAPLAPQVAGPQVYEPVPAPLPPAKPVSTPKPVKKPAVAKTTPATFPAEPPVYRDYGPVAQAQVEEPVKAPKAMNVGTVESVREIAEKGEGTGLGAVAGGVAGAVVGKQFGNGSGKTIMTVLGAAGGAYAGHEVEKRVRGSKRWEVTVRMEDGTYRTVSADAQPQWRTGDRVRMVDGRLQPV